jgi:putative ABC transport system permease protein
MSRSALDRTGLITEGSRAAQRLLFRFPQPDNDTPTVDVQSVRDRLKEAFPTALIADFRQVHPAISRGLESATTFLSLVSLIALIVGSLGVGMAMQAHLQQKLDSIAIMKAVGARSSQILKIYGIQTLMLGGAGALCGVAAGTLVQRSFPLLLERYFPIAANIGWEPLSALQGIAVGILSTLLFTLPTLIDIRRIKPNLILRREVAEAQKGWRHWVRESRAAVVTGAVLVLGIGAIASWLSNSVRLGLYFVGAILLSLLILNAAGWLLLRVVRFALERPTLRVPATLRHGLGNIYRPGNHARSALVALGVGVTFTLTVYLVQGSMLQSLVASAPPTLPNVFFVNVQPHQQEALLTTIRSQAGLLNEPMIQSSVSMRLDRVGERKLADFQLEGFDRRFLRERNGREAAVAPEGTTIVNGTWWTQPPPAGQTAFVSVAEEAAKALQIELGMPIRWVAAGQTLEATVLAIHRTAEGRMDGGFDFLFSPGALQALPTIYFGAVRMEPKEVPTLQRASFRQFPNITVINVADVLAIVQEVLDQVTIFVEFVSLFAILAGVIILSSSVAGTRLRRIREVAILKSLGATRRRLGMIFSVEFTLLGLVAGLMGSGLATAFSALLLTRFFEASYDIAWAPVGVCILSTVVIANGAGWLASARILDQKPLAVLRGD